MPCGWRAAERWLEDAEEGAEVPSAAKKRDRYKVAGKELEEEGRKRSRWGPPPVGDQDAVVGGRGGGGGGRRRDLQPIYPQPVIRCNLMDR